MKEYIFKSERLGFRNWVESDTEPFANLNSDTEVMEFFPNIHSRSETERFIEIIKGHFEEYGYGWFAVDELGSNRFIGFIGLSHPKFKSDFTPCLEIGWRLAKEFWGKGYATEGAKACIGYAFTTLREPEILSFTAIQNARSEKVMKKIGMKKIGEFLHPSIAGSWLERHVLYKIENPHLPSIQ